MKVLLVLLEKINLTYVLNFVDGRARHEHSQLVKNLSSVCSLLGTHLLQNWENHVEGWPLAWVLVHADSDKLGDVGGDARRNAHT